jgi:hypothetical protein
VAPRCDPHDGEVYRLACGEAVLQRLLVVDTLEEALADTVGARRRMPQADDGRMHRRSRVPNAVLLLSYHIAQPRLIDTH